MSVQWDEGTLTADVGVSDTLAADTVDESSDITGITPEYTHGDVVVYCTSGTNFTEGEVFMDIYMRRRVSATATEEQDVDETAAPVFPCSPSSLLGQCVKVAAASGAATDIIPDVVLPSNDFTIVAHNRHSAAMTAVTIKILPKRFADV